MNKLRGHSMGIQCVGNTHLLGDLGHTPTMNFQKIIHSEIASFFRMLASCPHENLRSHMLITEIRHD